MRGEREEPTMYERILVAVDGSAASARAVSHAIALGKAFGAQLRILHVVDMGWLAVGPELAIDTHGIAAARRAAGEKDLALALEQARAAGLEPESRLVETGAPGQRLPAQIVEEAQAWRADLIVLGTHGRGGAERLFLGSVAEGVARRASVPVLLVHE
jgi:nucleotide-binding universal stress UspA family protein